MGEESPSPCRFWQRGYRRLRNAWEPQTVYLIRGFATRSDDCLLEAARSYAV